MTTTQELIELVKELRGGKVTCLEKRAAGTIESLSAEVERLKTNAAAAMNEYAQLETERDQLRAQVDQARAAHRKYEEDTLKLAQADDEERAQLEAQGEAVAWIRRHPDGTYSNELLCEWQIEQVRRDSGQWQPLYTHPAPAAPVDGELLEFVLKNGLPMERDGKYRYHGHLESGWHDTQKSAILAALHPTQPKGEKA